MPSIPNSFKYKPGNYFVIEVGKGYLSAAFVQITVQHVKILHHASQVSSGEQREKIFEFLDTFQNTHSLRGKDAILILSDPDIVSINNLNLPKMAQYEIIHSAEYHLKDEVPFPVDKTLVAWNVLSQTKDSAGNSKAEYLFLTADREVVTAYLEALNRCALGAVGITTPPLCYQYLLRELKQPPGSTAVLNIDLKASILSFYVNNRLHFVRVLPNSFEKIVKSLEGLVLSAEEQVELTYEEAKNILNSLGLPLYDKKSQQGKFSSNQILSLVRPQMEVLIREIRYSFEYFESQFKAEPPDNLYITGPGANIKNIDMFFANMLDRKVSLLQSVIEAKASRIDFSGINALEKNDVLSFPGAVLADTATMDLLPVEIRRKKKEFAMQMIIGAGMIVTASFFLYLLFGFHEQIGGLRGQLIQKIQRFSEIGDIVIFSEKTQIYDQMIRNIHSKEAAASGILKLLSQVVPEDVLLQELNVDKDVDLFRMRGKILKSATDEALLTQLVKDLQQSVFLNDASVALRQKIDGITVFEIVGELAYE